MQNVYCQCHDDMNKEQPCSILLITPRDNWFGHKMIMIKLLYAEKSY